MLYIILGIVVVLAAAVTLLRIRLRLELSDGRSLFFVGLGRSGPEFDLVSGRSGFRLFGFSIKGREKPQAKKPEKTAKEARPPKKKKPSRRKRSARDFLRVLPGAARALTRYAVSVLRAFYIEQLEGEIRGGFDQPDLTGSAFGFYQAALGVVPAVGRFRFVPVWEGPSIGGWARVSVAIPLYSLIGKTIVMFFRLPLRDLIKLAIGRKKGDQDVQ